MPNDTNTNVINIADRGGGSGGMPDAPDGGDIFYSEPPASSPGGVVPPETPAETTMELPAVRGPVSPEFVLRESGMPSAPDPVDGEYEEGEYVQPRSLADRLGDWLEYRLEVSRERHAGEAPFREAEIARKAALIGARTARETAMMEQNGKLHAAQMKARTDKAAARGRADAARSSNSGMGADKGGRSKAGGGGGSRGGGGSPGGSGRGGAGGGRGPGTHGSGGAARGNSPKGAGKSASGGRGGGSAGNASSGGSQGRRNGPGGSGKAGGGKGSSGGSGGGKNGSGGRNGSGGKNGPGGLGRGGSRGDGSGRAHNSPASSPRAERARGRQERAAARQTARHQRRSADQAANLADRTKDRDQDRANQQAERAERRKAERKAAKKSRREATNSADGRTTFGEAVAEGAQRRWDKRRAGPKSETADTKAGTGKVNLSKDTDTKSTKNKDGTEGGSADGTGGTTNDGKTTGKAPKDGTGPDSTAGDGTKKRRRRGSRESRRDSRESRRESRKSRRESRKNSPFDVEDKTPRVEWPDHPTRPPRAGNTCSDDDIVDADIVPDPTAAITTGVRSLPPAPEKYTARPGTSRPTSTEGSSVSSSEVSTPTSGQAGMAAKHRTDTTFGEYLTDMVNIAIAAGLDKDGAQDLAVALGKVADALRDMAGDLIGDHNIDPNFVNQITNRADEAARMKQLAQRSAAECETASEAARLAASSVGRVYGEDIQAMEDAGLAHASAAAHHD